LMFIIKLQQFDYIGVGQLGYFPCDYKVNFQSDLNRLD